MVKVQSNVTAYCVSVFLWKFEDRIS